MRSSLLREHGQIGKSVKPSMAARPARLRTSSLRCARRRANALRCSKTLPAFLVRTSSLRCTRRRANALRCSKTLPAFLVRTSSLRCARSRANASRCSKTLPAFLSGQRDAFLFCPCSLRVEFIHCGKIHPDFDRAVACQSLLNTNQRTTSQGCKSSPWVISSCRICSILLAISRSPITTRVAPRSMMYSTSSS